MAFQELSDAAAVTTPSQNPIIKLGVPSWRLQGVTGQPRHSKVITFWSSCFGIRHFFRGPSGMRNRIILCVRPSVRPRVRPCGPFPEKRFLPLEKTFPFPKNFYAVDFWSSRRPTLFLKNVFCRSKKRF